MSELERILSIIHDLKSPVLGIKRLSQNLLNDTEALPEGVRWKIRLIHDSAEEASKSLNNLNTSALDPSGAFAEPINLVETAQHIVKGFRVQAECKEQALRFTPPPPEDLDDCFISGHPALLREAMKNLVSNAIKFSSQGTSIEVQVGRCKEAVCFAVSDEGPGLSKADREQLFDPFQQADPDPTGEEESTGMGLYLVDQIVEKHDGSIDIESSEGEGSTFKLAFPPASSEESSSSMSSRSAGMSLCSRMLA